MTHQDDLHSADAADQPTMELLDGAEAPTPVKPSFAGRLVKGSLYGILLLSATTLLAISAVPELALLVPENRPEGTCHLSSGSSCTALDVASLKGISGSPCCPLESALAKHSSGCCQDSPAVASVATESAECCEKSGSCCDEEGLCPLTLAKSAEAEAAVEDALAKLPSAEELSSESDVNEPPAPPLAE